MVAINIHDNSVLEGYLSPKALSLVVEWMKIHKKELLEMWETQEFVKLPPLE